MSEATVRISYPKNSQNPQGLPLPTQVKFHNSNSKYRLLAGGFGCGKSTSLIIEVLCQLFHPSYKNNYGVLGRKDLGELKSTTLKDFLDICPAELISNHNKQDHWIDFINGSRLFYMNLDDSREATEKIKSLNLGFVAIDQLEEIQEAVFLAFQGRLRRNDSGRNFFATCNPAGHDWLWDRWKNNQIEGFELFEAITTENIYLPADYVKELLAYPERWVKRYVFCSWEDFEGLVFNEFIEAKHKTSYYDPFDIDEITICMDYGFRNPTAVLFAATNYDGITTFYDEYYEAGKLISDVATEIKSRKFFDRGYKIADPSISKAERDGSNVAMEYLLNGIVWNPADNDVRQGINRVNEMFKSGRLQISSNCVNLIREIGNYKWKALKPGEVKNEYEEPIKRDDHCCLIADTKILMHDYSLKNIQDVKVGEYVITSQGIKKVLVSCMTGVDMVYELTIGEYGLIGTGNHPIFTVRGKVPIDSLRYFDYIAIKKVSICQLLTKVKNIIGTGIITPPSEDVKTVAKDFMLSFTQNHMEKSRKDMKSITKILIEKITTFLTYNFSQNQNMHLCMEAIKPLNKFKEENKTLIRLDHLQSNGMPQTREDNGTPNTASNAGKIGNRLSSIVNFVVENIKLLFLRGQSFVIRTAGLQVEDQFIKGLELKPLNMKMPVYNLEVEDAHNYYANNILVSNCDALRYIVNYLYAPIKPKEIKPISARQAAVNLIRETKTITSF